MGLILRKLLLCVSAVMDEVSLLLINREKWVNVAHGWLNNGVECLPYCDAFKGSSDFMEQTELWAFVLITGNVFDCSDFLLRIEKQFSVRRWVLCNILKIYIYSNYTCTSSLSIYLNCQERPHASSPSDLADDQILCWGQISQSDSAWQDNCFLLCY